MSDQPALAPPPGVVPNFVDPPSQGYLLIVTVATCLTVSTLLVLPRFYLCAFTTRPTKWDDGMLRYAQYLVSILTSDSNLHSILGIL